MTNLKDHHRIFPLSEMPDVQLPPERLRALAEYMATRR